MSKFELVSFVFFVTLCLAFIATVLLMAGAIATNELRLNQ